MRHLGWVVAATLIAVSSRARAQSTDQLTEQDRTKRITAQTPMGLKAGLISDTFWSDVGTEECKKARKDYAADKAYDPRTAGSKKPRPPRVRYATIQTLRQCILSVKSTFVLANATDTSKVLQADLVTESAMNDLNADATKADGEAVFLGMRFGVGVGFSYANEDIVSDAVVGPGNSIVATQSARESPRVIFETHYYGLCHARQCNLGSFGIGPYFGIVAKSDKLISAFSAGVMFGWRDKRDGDHQGMSIGVGALLDEAVKSLANGFEVGKPLPAGATSILFEEKPRWSGILFFTRTF